MVSRCRGCNAEILWLTHPTTGKPHPYNFDGRTSHFTTCPRARDFAPKKGQPPAIPGTQFTLEDSLP